ncbi:MAG: zinc ribbon domain-containing protein [Thermoguttaceae bacterium]
MHASNLRKVASSAFSPMRFLLLACSLAGVGQAKNLLDDPSFEIPKERDQFGLVFAKWGGWKYEGDCEFRVGQMAHSGKHSCLLFGGAGAKIRVVQTQDLAPGRYRITAYLRGLDIGTGTWNATTEFMFNDKYMQLSKNGTFGWTKLTYVGEIKEKKKAGPSFGLMAPGYFWIDDVSLEKVADDAALTEKPELGKEESAIEPPGELGVGAIHCPECGYRNMPAWKTCFGCGTPLDRAKSVVAGEPLKSIASFEGKNPFSGGVVVEGRAIGGGKSLRIDKSYVSMDRPQDWTGYDFLKADLDTDAKDPIELYVEIRDNATRDYWTRVNYVTVVPPGRSTLVIPVKQLYVGEKSRPGRMLDLGGIVRVVLNIGDKPPAPLFVSNLRLERDDSLRQAAFAGLYAFDFGTSTSPVMEGFTQITPGTIYSKGRGYGLKDARIWRALDVLQPDPLYQDFLCIESGGLAVDLPNGRYRVFVNIDNPSGYWGEYQVYRQRAILAQGKQAVSETMDFDAFQKKYYRFWNVEDLPDDNTFDKYQKAYFREKMFDVDVSNGQLNLGFQGENWACSVSAVVIFPVEKAAEGQQFLRAVEARRRFYFDNYFKRVLHRATGDPLQPTTEDRQRGYLVFQRNYMQEVYYNDRPRKEEIGRPLHGSAFAGEYEPLTMTLRPLANLGKVRVTASDLAGPAGTIPAAAIDMGYVSYRISRVTMDGAIYTIRPRLIMPGGTVEMPNDIARRFWLTVKTPIDAKPGLYKGFVAIEPQRCGAAQIPVEFHVRKGTLDPVDVPAGPWGCTINTPWDGGDPAAAAHNTQMFRKSLRKIREYGFTACSGIPTIAYRGFEAGRPVLDFSLADVQMKAAKELGFLAVVGYGAGVSGFDPYYQDTAQMTAAGFQDYSEFIKAVYTEIQKHADQNGWIPVYYNLGDEPVGDDLRRAAENAEAYRRAFPKGPPYFTAASSFTGSDRQDPHLRLSQALHVADWNGHDEAAVRTLHASGNDWAFYNGGNRWTFGTYMYKAAKQFDMKFRLSWHWNCVAGDPYYALDCREDDYAWCNSSPDGQLIPAVEFEWFRQGLGDYRRLITLARLARQAAGAPAAAAGQKLIDSRMAAFKLGDREHESLFPVEDWADFRRKLDDAIEALRR